MLTIKYEHPSSEYHFERKLQANIYPSDQLKKKLRRIDKVQRKYHDELRKFSSGPIQNELLTLTSETSSS